MSKVYEIFTGVPVPQIRRGAPRTGYPFGELEVGQCFFVASGSEPEKVVDRLKGASARWRKSNGLKAHKFTVALHLDALTEQESVGVWRTA